MKKRVFNFIKQLIVNTLATTTMSIVLTSLVSLIAGGKYMGFTVPLEILLANFLVHIGFILINKIDMKYNILNYIVMLIYSLGIVIGFCFLFNWCEIGELWIICLIVIIVFIVAFVIDLIKIKQDADEINASLNEIRKRKDNENK
ncbi:MAG: hypothetical protein HDT29_05620 [Clostridiales bacterium]|nr:hypothetical protein [Clostridiales bacterium]